MALDKLPKVVTDAVKKMFPKSEMLEATQEEEDGKIEYEVTIKEKGKKIDVAYVFDTTRGIKLFADQAFFAVDKGNVAPFLLKKDAEEYAAKNNAKVLGFEDAVKSVVSGGKT